MYNLSYKGCAMGATYKPKAHLKGARSESFVNSLKLPPPLMQRCTHPLRCIGVWTLLLPQGVERLA